MEEVDAIHIRGGNALFGETTIQGSKNAVLPVMAAALLINDVCTIENCPRIQDVEHMKNLLQSLGCKVKRSNRAITVDASCLTDLALQQEAIRNENVTCMRSSIMLLGAMLGRIGEVSLAYPGGCVIGERPIDLHIRSLKKMGVEFYEEEGYFRAYTRGLKGAVIRLPVASVGATENIVLAAVKARGVTVLQNAAKEPEIISLCEFLTKAGAIIEGTGTDTLLIKGLEELHGLGFTTAAMALSDDSISLDDLVWRLHANDNTHIDKLALIFGTEGDGLSRHTIANADLTVKIPMSHDVDSLNVAASSAVAFYSTRDLKHAR